MSIKPNEILSKKLERYLRIQLYENLVENNENEDLIEVYAKCYKWEI